RTGENGSIKELKARTIKANGSVIELDRSKMKTDKDEHGNIQYHVAFENVNVGDEVEYYFEEFSPVDPFGSEVMQFGIPIVEARFELHTPPHLGFDCKGYNGFPDATLTETDSLNTYKAEQKNVDAIKDEEYADVDVYSM